MRAVTIDAAARRARVEAGALWMDVTAPAAEHGLAALAGSSPDVGVVGYTLGGGLCWLSRALRPGRQPRHGDRARRPPAASRSAPTRESHPDLFWALRGGGGSFGVVTAIEIELFPIETVYAGVMFWPQERAREVLQAWREWTEPFPDEIVSVGRILNPPPLPEVPEPVRGKKFVVVEAIYLGEEAEGAELIEPLRALGPAMDTFARSPPRRSATCTWTPTTRSPARATGC